MQQILCNQIKACPDIGFRALSFALHFPAILNLPNIQVEQGRELLRLLKVSKNITVPYHMTYPRLVTQPSETSREKLYLTLIVCDQSRLCPFSLNMILYSHI